MAWAVVGILASAALVIGILYSKLKAQGQVEAQLKAEADKRALAEAAFAEAQRNAQEKDLDEASKLSSRADARDWLLDSYRRR